MQKIKIFFTKNRFFRRYETKKRLLVVFLVIVNVYIWYNVSKMLPAVDFSIQWHSDPITIENRAKLQNLKPSEIIAETSDSLEVQTLKKVGRETGVDWKVLYGIFIKESQGDCERIGDTHLAQPSIGCFQISLIYHPEIKLSQAIDLEWSARWTAERLKKYAEKGGIDYAVAKHNGNPNLPQVQAYLQDVKKIIASL